MAVKGSLSPVVGRRVYFFDGAFNRQEGTLTGESMGGYSVGFKLITLDDGTKCAINGKAVYPVEAISHE